MTTLRLILGDQLTQSISSLRDCHKKNDIILMCEVMVEATYVKHHKKKIAFLFSAMRHFAEELKCEGYTVRYTQISDKHNAGSLFGEVQCVIQDQEIERVVVTESGEYRVQQDFLTWQDQLNVPVDIRRDDRFLCSIADFESWAHGRKQLRMEYFYRDMRKQFNILMEAGEPVGGKWNFDSSNRQSPDEHCRPPEPYSCEPDTVTLGVLDDVEACFPDHFGTTDDFIYAVSREQALQALSQFIDERLSQFGDYQDAMIECDVWMYHSHIALYLNSGLLLPLECIEKAEQAYYAGKAPLNSVEGFIRQVLGWREFIRGIYWLKMPDYAEANFFGAKRPLPDFYWSAQTKMNCLKQCVSDTREHAYAHHIQRLMVLGNFALLTGLSPKEVNAWFLAVYADAYEWVEMPNVTGMALFADGGVLASKPYAAGGAYINKMSNYCKNCHYKVSVKNGEKACPFNYLYWNFLSEHREKLTKNPRVAMMYRTLGRMTDEKQAQIAKDAAMFLERLDKSESV